MTSNDGMDGSHEEAALRWVDRFRYAVTCEVEYIVAEHVSRNNFGIRLRVGLWHE